MADEQGQAVSGSGGGPVLFDTSVAHVARVYDYWLGGKDNFAADRGNPAGATEYIDADLNDPPKILDGAAELLDFSRPVAVTLMAVLQHIDDERDPYAVVATLMSPLPAGSYLAISHPASDIDAEAMAKMAGVLNKMMAEKVTFRDRAAVSRFFTGLELVEPGLVQASKWRPASESEAASPAALWAGVARKN
jgi:hypothetical protein